MFDKPRGPGDPFGVAWFFSRMRNTLLCTPVMASIACGGIFLPSVLFGEDLEEFIPEVPFWGESVEARASAGYKDNLLLSDSHLESSPFLSAGLDLAVWRLPLDAHQFNLLLSGDYSYYPEGRQVTDEKVVVGIAQYQYDLGSSWRLGGILQYLYFDQVMDLSTTETATEPILVQGHAVGLKPSLRRDLAAGWWLELEGYLDRQFFKTPLDDYWEGGPKLSLGRDYGHRSNLTLSYGFTARAYDERERLDADGNVDGAGLKFLQQEWAAVWRHHWDAARHWRTLTRLGLQLNRDNGGGYFDYNRYQISQQLRYQAGNWKFQGQARAAYYDFTTQRVSLQDPVYREKVLFTASLRGERTIVKHLKAFAEYEYERSLSNRHFDEYIANKVGAGVDWEF